MRRPLKDASTVFEELALLNQLGEITHQSLEPIHANLKKAKHTPALPKSTPLPQPRGSFVSTKKAYQPALKDHSLVKALLEFHNKKTTILRPKPPTSPKE
jgi:hypothetical protein